MAMGARPAALENGAVVVRSASLIIILRLAVPAEIVGFAMVFCMLEGLEELADRAFVIVIEGRQSVGGKCRASTCIVGVREECGVGVVLCMC